MRAKWTDLAVEAAGGELREGGLSRTVVKVEDEASARRLGRPMGTYVTLACEQALTVSLETRRALAAELAKTLRGMLPEGMKTALVVGLGNRSVTPDSLGPRTVERVLVTRHIGDSLPWGAELNSVCAAAPGVLGVTGMETAEILRGMVAHVRPDAVIAVDALAARSSKRIASTIQIADTGITPGSGVGNHRKALDRETLGVPVVAVGRRGGGGRHRGLRGARGLRKGGGDDRHPARGGRAGGAHGRRAGRRNQSGTASAAEPG